MSDFEIMTRADLRAAGWTRATIDRALREGSLVRARRDRYVSGTAPGSIVEAVRVGGRLACLSLLAVLGVFVFTEAGLHVHLPHNASRLRSSLSRARPLASKAVRAERLHWNPLCRPDASAYACISVVDALIQSVRCQPERHAIATIDSALHKGLIALHDLGEVFEALPARYAALRPLIDARAESGPETLVRLMLRGLGCTVRLQVRFDGIGRVDLLVDDWLVIECDSRQFHSEWADQLADRRRDLRLAARGYAVLRLTAEDIMYHEGRTLAAIRGLVGTRR